MSEFKFASVLEWNCQHGHLNASKFLIETNKFRCRYDSALIIACHHGHLEIVKLLLENGANINAENGKALCTALIYERTEIIKFLVNEGAIVSDALLSLAEKHYNVKLANVIINSLLSKRLLEFSNL
jgi:ankyrin repeat protein